MLTKDYQQIPKYNTKQKILVPESSDSEEEENAHESQKSHRRDFESEEDEHKTDMKDSKAIKQKAKLKGELVSVRLKNGER